MLYLNLKVYMNLEISLNVPHFAPVTYVLVLKIIDSSSYDLEVRDESRIADQPFSGSVVSH